MPIVLAGSVFAAPGSPLLDGVEAGIDPSPQVIAGLATGVDPGPLPASP
ncbi:MAG TPA: hypothetical protein VFH02_13470 [Jiangellaceae bacterium]|nr:hypothetical protein [Jiangellaceae bacterium]